MEGLDHHEFQRNWWSQKNIGFIDLHILKQPSKDVMQKSCSENFRKIHRKTSVVETFFSKVAGI